MSKETPNGCRSAAGCAFDLQKLAAELAARFDSSVQELDRELAHAQKSGELCSFLARLWRIDRFTRFKNRQHRKREWINFREIVDWCSELGGTAERDEARRGNAYSWLQEDLLAGDFEDAAGRSRVLYLFHRIKRVRMTRDNWLIIVGTHPADISRSEFLDRCWLERPMFQGWLAKHELPLSPPRFEPYEAGELNGGNGADNASRPTSNMPSRPQKPGQRQAAWDALKKRFADERIPNDVPSSTLLDIVNRYIERNRDVVEGRIRQKVGLDTVLRAAGRRE